MPTANPFSQLNTSPAKAMYSFGKSNRPSLAKKVQCDTFYNIPSTKSHRQASIGYGNKISIGELNKSQAQIPPPGTYNIADFAVMDKTHHKGFSIGVGRQVTQTLMKETKNQSFVQFDKSVPGPQKYKIEARRQGPRYSLRKRIASETFVKNSSKFIPGPGRYDPASSINPEGKYWVSKWSSSKAKRFDPQSSARFPETSKFGSKAESQVPGPGKYTPRNSTWTDVGHMTESKYLGSGNRVFGTGNRSTIFEEGPKKVRDIPGPGMYQSFSDFGSINDCEPKKQHRTIRPLTSDAYKR